MVDTGSEIYKATKLKKNCPKNSIIQFETDNDDKIQWKTELFFLAAREVETLKYMWRVKMCTNLKNPLSFQNSSIYTAHTNTTRTRYEELWRKNPW